MVKVVIKRRRALPDQSSCVPRRDACDVSWRTTHQSVSRSVAISISVNSENIHSHIQTRVRSVERGSHLS